MEWRTLISQTMEYFRKYRYVLLIVLIGVFFLLLPETGADAPVTEAAQVKGAEEIELQDALGEILGKIEGAGKVEVLLTKKEGERILYQTDEQRSGDGDIRTETILITESSRSQDGLVMQILPPIYQGAIVLCQGADRAQIRLSVVDAVMDATGLTSDKITVLKMK